MLELRNTIERFSNPPQQLSTLLSKAYYEKYGFKLSSSSCSSDDEQKQKIALLKKRNYRDFQQKQHGDSIVDLCDDTKFLKLYEHERSKKKAKYVHL